MADRPEPTSRSLTSVGWRVAGRAARPFVDAGTAAAGAAFDVQRRTVKVVIDAAGVEDALRRVLANKEIENTVRNAFRSDVAKQVVAGFVESEVFNEIINQLLDSDALWRLVDDIAASPAVRAAVTQQGLGFADQMGDEVRSRSRRADDWLERKAHRLARRRAAAELPAPDEGTDGVT